MTSFEEIDETAIYNMLVERPGQAYIIPNGYAVYLLVPGGLMKISATANLHDMTDEELNRFIIEFVTYINEQE